MPALRPSALARHWGTAPSYISMLRARKCMPEFASLEEADAWRALNAPPRRHSIPSAQLPVAQVPAATPPTIPEPIPTPAVEPARMPAASPEKTAPAFSQNNNHPQQPPGGWIDINTYLAPQGTDFETLMLRHAEEVAQVAHGLYLRACATGDAGQIAAHLKNWSDAVSRAKDLREKFLELQERSRRLINVDHAMDVVGTALQDLRLLLVGLGERVAPDANPAEPALAKRIVDAAVDAIFERLSATTYTLTEEIAST